MGKFIDKFLRRKDSDNPEEIAQKQKHKQKIALMIAELEDIREYWNNNPKYPGIYHGSGYCPVKSKLFYAEEHLRRVLISME